MNRFTTVSVLLTVTLAAATACKKKDNAGAGGATGSAVATGSAAPAATPDAATPPPAEPDAAAPAPALAAGAISGPHTGLDAYCAAVAAAFVPDSCAQGDETDMCSCDVADKDDLTGNVKAGGKSANLVGAQLVVVADAAADYAHCSLAVQLAGGWHIVHKAFPCKAAPVSHDGGIDVTVNLFNITGDNKLKLAWTADDGKGKKKFAIECTAAAADKVECTAPAAK